MISDRALGLGEQAADDWGGGDLVAVLALHHHAADLWAVDLQSGLGAAHRSYPTSPESPASKNVAST